MAENSQQNIIMLEAFTLTSVCGSLFNPQVHCMVFVMLKLSEAKDQNVSQCRVYNFYKALTFLCIWGWGWRDAHRQTVKEKERSSSCVLSCESLEYWGGGGGGGGGRLPSWVTGKQGARWVGLEIDTQRQKKVLTFILCEPIWPSGKVLGW